MFVIFFFHIMLCLVWLNSVHYSMSIGQMIFMVFIFFFFFKKKFDVLSFKKLMFGPSFLVSNQQGYLGVSMLRMGQAENYSFSNCFIAVWCSTWGAKLLLLPFIKISSPFINFSQKQTEKINEKLTKKKKMSRKRNLQKESKQNICIKSKIKTHHMIFFSSFLEKK